MPRIAGVDVPLNKSVYYSLQSVYGVGKKIAADVLTETNIKQNTPTNDLTADQVARIQKSLERYNLEGDLRRQINDNVDRLRRNGSYRGKRHIMGLPVRGQRTKVNSRTVRGNKRHTIGSLTKEMAQKLDTAKTGK